MQDSASVKIFPTSWSDAELRVEIAELSKRVTRYDPRHGNAEDLIKDSFLFNICYAELQSRDLRQYSRRMFYITVVSLFVAIVALVIPPLLDRSREESCAELSELRGIRATLEVQKATSNCRIERHVNDKVPSSGMSARGAHAER